MEKGLCGGEGMRRQRERPPHLPSQEKRKERVKLFPLGLTRDAAENGRPLFLGHDARW